MAVPIEHVDRLRAGIENAPEWREAWERANAYLDALHWPTEFDRASLLFACFERAITRKKQNIFVPATQLAFEELQRGLSEMGNDHDVLGWIRSHSEPAWQLANIVPKPFELTKFGIVCRSLIGRCAQLSQSRRDAWLFAGLALAIAVIGSW